MISIMVLSLENFFSYNIKFNHTVKSELGKIIFYKTNIK